MAQAPTPQPQAQASGQNSTQAWPSRPVKLLVGYPPGGVADVMARSVAQILSDSLKQPVVVETRAGANGNVALDAAVHAPADGYTFAVVSTGVESVNPYLFGKMPFDVQKNVAYVAAFGKIKVFLTTKQTLPVTDVKSFISYAKAAPTPPTYGSAGNGSTPHLIAELFRKQAGFAAVHVPYRGAAPALQDLVAGQLDFVFDPGISFPFVRAGKVKMLAVASASRSELFPDVPTLAEAGYPGIDYDTWFGIMTSSDVPPEIVQKMNAAVNVALADPGLRGRYKDLGGEAMPMSSAAFKQVAVRETPVFSQLIKERDIKAD